MKDYYKILQVDRKSTPADIKKSYRALAKKFHPDANANNPKAEEVFKEISEAYNTLSDEKKKSAYDMHLNGGYASTEGKEKKEQSSNNYERQKRNMTETEFRNMGSAFESFFGFDPKGDSHNLNQKDKDVQPMKTKDAYNKIFGFRK